MPHAPCSHAHAARHALEFLLFRHAATRCSSKLDAPPMPLQHRNSSCGCMSAARPPIHGGNHAAPVATTSPIASGSSSSSGPQPAHARPPVVLVGQQPRARVFFSLDLCCPAHPSRASRLKIPANMVVGGSQRPPSSRAQSRGQLGEQRYEPMYICFMEFPCKFSGRATGPLPANRVFYPRSVCFTRTGTLSSTRGAGQ